jgi:hypothetical protein
VITDIALMTDIGEHEAKDALRRCEPRVERATTQYKDLLQSAPLEYFMLYGGGWVYAVFVVDAQKPSKKDVDIVKGLVYARYGGCL